MSIGCWRGIPFLLFSCNFINIPDPFLSTVYSPPSIEVAVFRSCEWFRQNYFYWKLRFDLLPESVALIAFSPYADKRVFKI